MLRIGALAQIKPCGREPHDLMYAGCLGKIVRLSDTGDLAFVNSDLAGRSQAVSFRQWFACDLLEAVEDGTDAEGGG